MIRSNTSGGKDGRHDRAWAHAETEADAFTPDDPEHGGAPDDLPGAFGVCGERPDRKRVEEGKSVPL